MGLHYLDWQEVFGKIESEPALASKPKVWGPPRGGAIVAGLIQALGKGVAVMSPDEADIFVDDIYDSGSTQRRTEAVYGRKQWWFVIDRRKLEEHGLPVYRLSPQVRRYDLRAVQAWLAARLQEGEST